MGTPNDLLLKPSYGMYCRYVGAICCGYPLGAAMTVTPFSNVTGPGQPKLDSGSPQQAGFPCQMLYESFWAATHLLLHNPPSLTSEQH